MVKACANLAFFIWTHELLPLDILLMALTDRDDDPHALRIVVWYKNCHFRHIHFEFSLNLLVTKFTISLCDQKTLSKTLLVMTVRWSNNPSLLFYTIYISVLHHIKFDSA